MTYFLKAVTLFLYTCPLVSAHLHPIPNIDDVINFVIPSDINCSDTTVSDRVIHDYCITKRHGHNCNSNRHVNMNRIPVAVRSSCPWYYKIDHDMNRFPATILKAVLRCNTTCRESGPQFTCETVNRHIKVLQKTIAVEGHVKYIQNKIPVPVGFSCSKLSTVFLEWKFILI